MRVMSALLGLGMMSSSALAANFFEPVVPVEPIGVPEAFNWTGGYVGLNAGWAFEAGGDDGGFDGPFIGAQAGFNFQTGIFVLGVEGDIQWANIDGNGDGLRQDRNADDMFTNRVERILARGEVLDFDERFNDGTDAHSNTDISWFGTLRLRGGVALDRTLLYATGGLAFGDADFTAPILGRGGGVQRGVALINGRRVRVAERIEFRGYGRIAGHEILGCALSGGGGCGLDMGWALGGGVEHAFTDAVSVKAEYQYINLDNDEVGSDTYGIYGFRDFTIQRGDRDPKVRRNDFTIPYGDAGGDIDFHTLRVGVNLRF